MEMFGFWRSQATFRVRVALRLKGVAYDERPVDLDAGAQNADDFRRINPLGSVPALMIGGRPLAQSSALLEYIEETYPEPPLLPADGLGRARVRALAAIAISDTHPLIVPRIKTYLAAEAGFDAARWKAWQTQWFAAGLQGLEARLQDSSNGRRETGAYCHGETPTMADICLVGLLAGAETFDIEVAGIPTVRRIAAQCRTLPAFTESAAARQADYPG